MSSSLQRYWAAIEFKGAGATTRIVNLLAQQHIFSVAELRAAPWTEQPHVRGLERRLLAARGCGPVQLAQIRNIYEHGHVDGRREDQGAPQHAPPCAVAPST